MIRASRHLVIFSAQQYILMYTRLKPVFIQLPFFFSVWTSQTVEYQGDGYSLILQLGYDEVESLKVGFLFRHYYWCIIFIKLGVALIGPCERPQSYYYFIISIFIKSLLISQSAPCDSNSFNPWWMYLLILKSLHFRSYFVLHNVIRLLTVLGCPELIIF